MGVSANVDERTLHEIYYPAWEAAVAAGGCGAVMCSYNRINGIASCANKQTLHTDLRGLLGFRGFIVSDWGATGAGSLAATQDMEMPGGGTFNSTLRAQIVSGQVPVTTLDEMVTRILSPLAAVGALDRPPCPDCVHTCNASSVAGNRAARAAATAGMVLLKNARNTLPVGRAVKRLVVVGPGAHERPTTSQPFGSGPSRTFLRVKADAACKNRARAAAPHCGPPPPRSHCRATTADRTATPALLV